MLSIIVRRKRRKLKSKKSAKSSSARLSVYRSNKKIYAQIIDDNKDTVLVSAHEKELTEKGTKSEKAYALGEIIGKKAKDLKITAVTFDRSGYKYHGRVQKLAEGARAQGLKF